jgi:hypothetical protein
MHRDPSDRTTPIEATESIHLLSDLPGHLTTELFASAKRVRLAAGNTLFKAGDSGDDCCRIEDGLLKVTISHSGEERILAFVGRGDIVGKGRVARTMLELAELFGQEVGSGRIVIRQKIRQNDLAAMAALRART